jgi:hypothetical protein
MLVISRPIDCKRSVAPNTRLTTTTRPTHVHIPSIASSPPLIPHPIPLSPPLECGRQQLLPIGRPDLGFSLPGAGFPPPAARTRAFLCRLYACREFSTVNRSAARAQRHRCWRPGACVFVAAPAPSQRARHRPSSRERVARWVRRPRSSPGRRLSASSGEHAALDCPPAAAQSILRRAPLLASAPPLVLPRPPPQRILLRAPLLESATPLVLPRPPPQRILRRVPLSASASPYSSPSERLLFFPASQSLALPQLHYVPPPASSAPRTTWVPQRPDH